MESTDSAYGLTTVFTKKYFVIKLAGISLQFAITRLSCTSSMKYINLSSFDRPFTQLNKDNSLHVCLADDESAVPEQQIPEQQIAVPGRDWQKGLLFLGTTGQNMIAKTCVFKIIFLAHMYIIVMYTMKV